MATTPAITAWDETGKPITRGAPAPGVSAWDETGKPITAEQPKVSGFQGSDAHRDFELGFMHAFGFKEPEPGNPHSITLKDMATQFISNLAASGKQSWDRVNHLDKSPDALTPVAGSIAFVPHMIGTGIDGMASTLQDGGRDIMNGNIAMGAGKIVGALGQVFAGAEGNPVSPVELAQRAVEFSPREVVGTQITGAARPFNVLQGAINKSLGASVRDVRFGDPAKAMVEEGINNLSTNGRLAEVNIKLSQLMPQINDALARARGNVNLDNILDGIIKQTKEKIRLSNETDATKNVAYTDLQTLRNTAHEHAPSGQASAVQANTFKQAIGDSVNWEKRPTPLADPVLDAYRQAYAAVKDQVNGMTGGETVDLNRRVTNLKAAQGALREQVLREKSGQLPLSMSAEMVKAVQEGAGKLAPGAINAAQPAGAAAGLALQAIPSGATMGEQLRAKGAQAPQVNSPALPFRPGAGVPKPKKQNQQ